MQCVYWGEIRDKSWFVLDLEETGGTGGVVGYEVMWEEGLMGRFSGQRLCLDIHEPAFGS